ncbi:membrane-associated guanylate kinase, WW and PDZ domain-containing protein 3-like isoform X2 [Stigmatopora argus]
MYIDAFKRILFERLNCLKRMCVCQRHESSLAMSKTAAARRQHWRSRTRDSWLTSPGEAGLAVGGGADYGEFPFVTAAPPDGPAVGDVVLEVGGTPVLGMTLGDVRGVLDSCPPPVCLKTVAPGATLCEDLRLYLSKCFTPGSVDAQLQQVIRQNLHLRTVPCTTRAARAGETAGTDYNFLSVEEFFSLEESGALLESGKFAGNYYGTPRPVHVGAENQPVSYAQHRQLLRKFRARSKSLSNLEKGGPGGADSPAGPWSEVQERVSLANGGSSLAEADWDEVLGEPVDEDLDVDAAFYEQEERSIRQHPARESPSPIRGWNPAEPRPERLVRAHLTKGPGGFGFHVVGGGQPGELLQVYAVAPDGPQALRTADVLAYVDGVCVLGASHREVVEMLESVPTGGAVEVAVRRARPAGRGTGVGRGSPAAGEIHLGRSHFLAEGPARSPPLSWARLRSPEAAASQSDSEVVSAIGSHRAWLIRNHNNNSLSTPRRPFRHAASVKSSESDLSSAPTPPASRLPLPRWPERPWSSPGPSRFRAAAAPPPTGELVPVALGGGALGFSVTGGGPAGPAAVVGKIWDRERCRALRPGDAIVKINGADVKSLDLAQLQAVLQEHTKLGEVILLVYRGGAYPAAPPPPPSQPGDARVVASPPGSSLIQSTSFLGSVPVTLTLGPKDWTGAAPGEVARRGPETPEGRRAPPPRGFQVELRRKPGEGFGFVVASQDLENAKATSLLPHRFVTVRRGSPAAKSGQIRPGDRLEAVEGRSVVKLPHRELAQILRRAGDTLRLTIVPRPSTYSSGLSAEKEAGRGKSARWRPQRDSRYYSVDLDRGPSGFGFSLRGGGEYNMGLYVLALMEGGPASRSRKIQVSDQLVEINGESTAGMSHAQAVEEIRRGGRRVRLVLKKGNGFVPDYGREPRVASPSRPRHPEKQGVAAVDASGQRGRPTRTTKKKKKKQRDRSSGGRGKKMGRNRESVETEVDRGTPKGGEPPLRESAGDREETPPPVPLPDKNYEGSRRESEYAGDVAAGYREMRRLGVGRSEEDGGRREPFAFLASGEEESVSGGGLSEFGGGPSEFGGDPFELGCSPSEFGGGSSESDSESGGGSSDGDDASAAASVYGFSAPANERGDVHAPGPWLRPGWSKR